ncbi:hypothetical protein L1049_014413 [Liquidambar formosana]|uniref:N-acetyltransferase domain-containing protein n=1 Tax=Liquidambar formosana TaxID=63359 RepID=A0AAP0RR66_LIQFO
MFRAGGEFPEVLLFCCSEKGRKECAKNCLNSVVGTLDLSIRQYLRGETYPGEIKKMSAVLASQEPFDAHKYAYIANVCVSKFARRQGIASNMLYLARDVGTLMGMKQLFVHVNADNKPAKELYKKAGFKPHSSSLLGSSSIDVLNQDLRRGDGIGCVELLERVLQERAF